MLRTGLIAFGTFFALTFGAQAITLLPGTNLTDGGVFYEDAALDGTEADFFGTVQTTVSKFVNEKRDGFDGVDVIEDLYDVSAGIDVTAIRSASGKQVFAYDFSATGGLSPGINGATDFVLSGFKGYDVEFGYFGGAPGFPYAPRISRSANGNNINFEFFDPRDVEDPGDFIETFYFSTNAPTYNLSGFAMAGIIIDSFGTTNRIILDLPGPAAVPLPLPAASLGIGLLLLAGLRRRR